MFKKLIRVSKDEILNLTFEETLQKYRGLLVKLISKWTFKYEFDDLYQEASLGLWDAYKFHDVDNNENCFGTLAEKTIIYYISWYRQNNNKDKIRRETSKISDVCSYDSHDGYVDTFYDSKDYFNNIEDKVILSEVIDELKARNKNLKSNERKASERNIEFLELISMGFSQREISERYDLSISTVQRALYKEFSRIKKILRSKTYSELIA